MAIAPVIGRGNPSVLFEKSIAPILEARCVECHNPDRMKGELNLTTAEGIVKGGESGPVFEAGDAEKSHLFELVHSGEMPKKGNKLSPAEVELIREWIVGGAKFASPPKITASEMTQHDVLPIMLVRCVACHGRQKQDGGLDLRNVAAMKKGGKSGPAFVPGKPDGSRMIQRIESEACPPKERLLRDFVKRPGKSEVKKLREWILAGAPIGQVKPDVATTEPDPLVSEEDRQHWAFQPPEKPPRGDSIDFFIYRKLKQAGLDFSPQADRDALIRRAWFDLIGMPPSISEWKKWRDDPDPDWFAKMVDTLLDSPHYGERWGRYWLDVSGYADSEGGLSSDPVRKVAWKYRDYVINAFNSDKPYDEFLTEQIAGDELLDSENANPVTTEMVENLIATGFLRMGIDETGSRTMNYVENRIGVISDVISVLGSGVMGLTMECVRCHTHKYDPIPQRDYYRLKAVFQGALDEHDWLTFKNRTLSTATPEHRQRVKQVNPPLESELKKLESLRRKKITEWQREMLKQHYPDQPEADREATFIALRRADNQRSLEQRKLVEKLQIALLIPNDDQPETVQKARDEVEQLDQQIYTTERRMESPLTIRALFDRGDPSPTYIYRRGEYLSPGRLVGPGVPSVLTDGHTPFAVTPPFPEKTGRRLAFAKWLIRPDHPLTARVMVNRIWYHHFGAGIVRTLENFGMQSEPPTHPELLDWLAVEFVERGWSIKEMHRLILNSRAWRQVGEITKDRQEHDPQNKLLSRMSLRRMDAEALRDSLLHIAGKLDTTAGGLPDGITVNREGFVNAKAMASGGWRRSVYIQYRRTEIPSMMATFDYPEMGPNCVSRSTSTISPQSLMLMNNQRVRELSGALAERIAQSGTKDRIGMLYHLAMTRAPTPAERELGEGMLNQTGVEGWQAYCHAVLNSAGFIYID
ncbi:MAG: PSD1 and planctomycete cytochrome C domain-containing protein [Verrucomicrobiales bacterium]|nr:PSD1 and planctomycete cytochrome C domain-containing protein [Verrucomicrobiales bacterium]